MRLRLLAPALAVSLFAAPARAADGVCTTPACTAEVDGLIARALELRRAGKDLEALPLLEQASRRLPGARTSAQLGFVNQALGRWVDADAALAAALTAPDDGWRDRHRAAIESARAVVAGHLCTLEVLGPAGAAVRLDARVLGTLPLGPVRVVAGRGELTVRAPGRAPVSRILELVPGGVARETVEAGAPLPPARLPTPAVAPPVAAAPVEPETTGRARTFTIAGATLLATGVAFVAGGIGAHVVREQNAHSWNDADCGNNTTAACVGYRDTVHLTEGLLGAGYAIGGAAVIVGVGLLVAAHVPPRRPARHTVGGGPGLVGASWRVAF